MKSKRAKAKRSPVGGVTKPVSKQCWYCEFKADPGAEAVILLAKPDDDFQYFAADSEEEKKLIFTQVEIPRCVECKTAHDKLDNPRRAMIFFSLLGIILLGGYFGIFGKTLSLYSYLVIALGVSGAVIGIALGARRNFFTLPGHMKDFQDVRDQTDVKALLAKNWKVKM